MGISLGLYRVGKGEGDMGGWILLGCREQSTALEARLPKW